MRAIVVVLAVVLAGCAAGGPADGSYSSSGVGGTWQRVDPGDLRVGRAYPEMAQQARHASRYRAHDASAEALYAGNSGLMFDEAAYGYGLDRLGPGQMWDAVLVNLRDNLPAVIGARVEGRFEAAPASLGSLHAAPVGVAGDDCVAFVQQWPRIRATVSQMPKRLLGVICSADVAPEYRADLQPYVVGKVVPRIVAAVR